MLKHLQVRTKHIVPARKVDAKLPKEDCDALPELGLVGAPEVVGVAVLVGADIHRAKLVLKRREHAPERGARSPAIEGEGVCVTAGNDGCCRPPVSPKCTADCVQLPAAMVVRASGVEVEVSQQERTFVVRALEAEQGRVLLLRLRARNVQPLPCRDDVNLWQVNHLRAMEGERVRVVHRCQPRRAQVVVSAIPATECGGNLFSMPRLILLDA
mmetsp:Transcript_17398/g.44992  ORF Transcript_17398/g.44992 Transcript_17398/m.44992 type:complete len:213 (-) Transcript_17398:195-833(-)